MVVFGYLTDVELKNIVKKKSFLVGDYPSPVNGFFSKKYKLDVKYLHFFKNLRDLPKVQEIESSVKCKYFALFDIPMRSLIAGTGIGKYCQRNLSGEQTIKEFAMESKKFRSEYLIDYMFDKEGNISIEQVSALVETREKQKQ